MPRQQYSMGGRTATSPGIPGGGPAGPRSLRERFGALRNLPPFLKLIWRTSPSLTGSDLALRLVRALLPVATLYVGKLIIDEVVRLAQTPGAPVGVRDWLGSGLLTHLGWLLAAELCLAVLSDVLGRIV
jgi:ATP-binding cassette, subfamily B, bacterial